MLCCQRMDERTRLARWKAGQRATAARKRELLAEEGPDPEQAAAEALAALAALQEMDLWPGPRDPVSERAARKVRRRWARIQRHARASR